MYWIFTAIGFAMFFAILATITIVCAENKRSFGSSTHHVPLRIRR